MHDINWNMQAASQYNMCMLNLVKVLYKKIIMFIEAVIKSN